MEKSQRLFKWRKEDSEEKSQARVLGGAAFLMAISAIGPGFLTQTAVFTETHGANHGFIILISLILAVGVQLNVWRIIGASGLRGQDIANKVLPGLGIFITFLIALGGLAFNIGNIGGSALGLHALAGIPVELGYWISGLIAISVFLLKNAKNILDVVIKILAVVVIGIVIVVMFMTNPPYGEALHRTFIPNFENGLSDAFFPIMTYLGGTVGGYITFSGAHRLLDAKISGHSKIGEITKSSVLGVSVAAIMRVVLFLAVFGVILTGYSLSPVYEGDPANPAAIAFLRGAGPIGFTFFGLILFIAGLTSVIGAAYTSVTFMKTLFKPAADYENAFIIGFILISTIIMSLAGSPALLLVLVGFLNGLILPITLSVILLASKRKDIVGEHYKHPLWLIVLGVLIVAVTVYLSLQAIPGLIATLRA